MTTRSHCNTFWAWRVAAVLAALGCSASAVAATASIALRDGLIVNDTQVFTMRAGGGIEAIAIRSGTELWRSADADRPVVDGPGGLLAQRDGGARAGRLTMAMLDTRDGSTAATGSVGLPPTVIASVDERLDSRFVLQAVAGQADELVWRHHYRPVQGAPGAGGASRQSRAAGVIAVSATAGTLRLTPASRAAPADAEFARLADVAFAGADGRAFYSEDRAHVLVSRRQATSDYAWSLHTPDGSLLGKTRSRASFSPFVVRDGTLLFVSQPSERRVGAVMQSVPLSLRAVDLQSGAEAWSREIRDTRYDGPFPP